MRKYRSRRVRARKPSRKTHSRRIGGRTRRNVYRKHKRFSRKRKNISRKMRGGRRWPWSKKLSDEEKEVAALKVQVREAELRVERKKLQEELAETQRGNEDDEYEETVEDQRGT